MEKIGRLNPLLEAIRHSPHRFSKLFVQKDTKKTKIAEIIKLARINHIPYTFVPQGKLDRLDKNHQGAIAFFTPKPYTSLESVLAASEIPFLVLLDGIEDPQNLGAIIRTAEGAGADGIIIPERRSVGLTKAVSTVSAGALEYIRVARVKNLARVMDDLKKRGVWFVGAEAGREEFWYEFDYTLPVGVVFGSEGRGLRPLIQKKCDKVLSLPLLGSMNSLNVASAASIFLFEVARQRMGIGNE